MHGGAKGSGAPPGNQNALKHGTYTKKAFQERAEMRELFRDVQQLLRELDEPNG
jgi:glucans biosynthesis protein